VTVTKAEMERLGHLNQMDFFEWMALGTPGGRTADTRDDELAYSLPHGFAMMSGIMRSHERADADELLGRAIELFDDPSNGFFVFLRPGGADADLERSLGDSSVGDPMRLPQMVCAEPLPMPEPSGAEIREVGDLEAAADYWAVCGGAYPSLGFPADLFEIFTPEWLVDERIRAFAAYVEEEPVSCALAWISRGVAGIYWVATLAAARGRGLGATCSVAATNAGFERGGHFAALQASPMGESVYKRLGYRELYPYRVQFARIEAG
jgi:GNAT superfamily N-acetyltransferase